MAGGSAYTRKVQSGVPRVAYFPDSFHEVNGVAHTSRHFEAYARRSGLPFLCVRAGDEQQPGDGATAALELRRGFLSFALEEDLRYDPAFLRHLPRMLRALRAFEPDLIHVTGPSELGVAGALLAHHLHVPLVASWHTNVHEYLATRSRKLMRLLPESRRAAATLAIEQATLGTTARFYKLARLLFAPNPQLCRLLERATSRPCRLMPRGVDAELFSPARRSRGGDGAAILGFVGRLSVEKNVQLLPRMQSELRSMGIVNTRLLIVGHGSEEGWLRQQLPDATFAGVLRGAALAEAYANMDCFVFPSHTDTFGNVVLEAMASGVPVVVTPDGGPAQLVEEGVTGHIVADEGFAAVIGRMVRRMEQDAAGFDAMRQAARARALQASWDAVFSGLYAAYAELPGLEDRGRSS